MNNLIISHLTLRKIIGILGISLGFLCIIGGIIFGSGKIQPSISAYYATNMRDLMVGVLVIAGAFILSYKGYDKLDFILTRVMGISALGIVLFPCCSLSDKFGLFQISSEISIPLHFIMAAIFFLSIAIMSIFQFTKGNVSNKQKRKRNIIYKISGYGIIASMIIDVILDKMFDMNYIVIIMEVIMLSLFGLSWLTKGEAIFKDLEK